MISFENVTKIYKLYKTSKDRLVESLLPFGQKRHLDFFALKNVSFNVQAGETVGIIGKNGSGKSTILKILAGVVTPTSGSVLADGKIAALLELGAGFNSEYTGIENIYLNGFITGLTRAQINDKLNDILSFAEIGDFVNQKVKTYSSGMFVRLAFAVAVNTNPDILVVDEALAVGDYRFQAKCYKKFEELKKQGKTIIFVTHDVDSVRKFCTRAIWIDEAALFMDGTVNTVTSKYMEFIVNNKEMSNEQSQQQQGIINRFGSKIGSIKNININKKIFNLIEKIIIRVEIDVSEEINLKYLAVSVAIKNKEGLDLFVASTYNKDIFFNQHGKMLFEISFDNYFNSGQYSLAAALENRRSFPITYYDYIEMAAFFKVTVDESYFGLIHQPSEIKITPIV